MAKQKEGGRFPEEAVQTVATLTPERKDTPWGGLLSEEGA
jgi:hypothetical protein